jgi:RNA polymerase sigma factor (sigma-70 family)
VVEPLVAGRCTTSMVHRPDEDTALVKRARAGEPAAFARIVELHQGAAFRVAWVLCGNAADAEEATQDAFVKAHRALGRFRVGSPLRPWLLAIAANEARNRRRSAGRREHLAVRAAGESPAGASPSSETLALQADRDAGLRAAVARLDGADREVLWLRYFAELSIEETAAALGCRHGTVKSRTSRALARLRTELEASDG